MFARSQTTVCLDVNKCLPTGKYSKTASIVPQNMLLGSSLDTLFPLNSPSFLCQQPKKNVRIALRFGFFVLSLSRRFRYGRCAGAQAKGTAYTLGKANADYYDAIPKVVEVTTYEK